MDSRSEAIERLRLVARELEGIEYLLRREITSHREAVQHELVSAAVSIGRAMHLMGDQR